MIKSEEEEIEVEVGEDKEGEEEREEKEGEKGCFKIGEFVRAEERLLANSSARVFGISSCNLPELESTDFSSESAITDVSESDMAGVGSSVLGFEEEREGGRKR